MRTFVQLKMINSVLVWLEAKTDGETAGESGFVPDFHDFLFSRLGKEFSLFDNPTQETLFQILHAELEAWADRGICFWDAHRIALTPQGEGELGNSYSGWL